MKFQGRAILSTFTGFQGHLLSGIGGPLMEIGHSSSLLHIKFKIPALLNHKYVPKKFRPEQALLSAIPEGQSNYIPSQPDCLDEGTGPVLFLLMLIFLKNQVFFSFA